jgi:hypothetical protein
MFPLLSVRRISIKWGGVFWTRDTTKVPLKINARALTRSMTTLNKTNPPLVLLYALSSLLAVCETHLLCLGDPLILCLVDKFVWFRNSLFVSPPTCAAVFIARHLTSSNHLKHGPRVAAAPRKTSSLPGLRNAPVINGVISPRLTSSCPRLRVFYRSPGGRPV